MFRTTPARLIRVTALCAVLAAPAAAPVHAAPDADAAYEEAMAAGLWAEAETFAKERIENAIAGGRRETLETAELYGDLARAQRLNGEYDAARQNYELAIDIVESRRDMLALELIAPLRGLAETCIDSRRPDEAIPYIERALHVRHVNEGPHSLGQAPSLELLVTAYRQMGELDEAVAAADRLHLIYERAYPGKRMELVPVLLAKGRAHGDIGDRREERAAYERAAAIVRHNDGKDSPGLIAPLIHLGKSHQNEYFVARVTALREEDLPDPRLLREAEGFFDEAVDIATRAPIGESWKSVADAYLASADFRTLKDELGPAGHHYREAWRLLTEQDSGHEERRRAFETVVPLLEVQPDLTVALPHDADPDGELPRFDTGYIVTQFTITRRGRTKDIGLVEIAPARNDAIEAEVKTSLSRRVYRPRYENGLAVDAPGQVVRYEFPVPRTAAGGP